MLVAGTHRLAGSIGSHTDVLTTADALTSYSGLLQDSATALQAAVVQPHRALDRLRTYATLVSAAGLEPAAPSTTGDYPLSQHQYYEAITTTDSERQADRARRQTARLADYAVPSETHAQPQIRYCLTVVTSRTLPHKSIFCLSVCLSVLRFSRPLQRKKIMGTSTLFDT